MDATRVAGVMGAVDSRLDIRRARMVHGTVAPAFEEVRTLSAESVATHRLADGHEMAWTPLVGSTLATV